VVFLVTLGGYRHLDDLEQLGGGPAHVGDCSWSAPVIVFVRGSCGSPAECRIPTLVDCSCHCNLLPFGRFLWRLLRGSVCDRLATEPCD
jgi:hypothetical protein